MNNREKEVKRWQKKRKEEKVRKSIPGKVFWDHMIWEKFGLLSSVVNSEDLKLLGFEILHNYISVSLYPVIFRIRHLLWLGLSIC